MLKIFTHRLTPKEKFVQNGHTNFQEIIMKLLRFSKVPLTARGIIKRNRLDNSNMPKRKIRAICYGPENGLTLYN